MRGALAIVGLSSACVSTTSSSTPQLDPPALRIVAEEPPPERRDGPAHGWGPLHRGMSYDAAVAALMADGIPFEEVDYGQSNGPRRILVEHHGEKGTAQFDPSGRLEAVRVDGAATGPPSP